MCEIFPPVNSFCGCCGYRIGMLFISMFTIMVGVIFMAGLNLRNHVNYETINAQPKPEFNGLRKSVKSLTNQIAGLSAACSLVFIFAGLFLFCGTIWDSEGLVQVFVWGIFFDLLAIFILIFIIGYQCICTDDCFIGADDWLLKVIGTMIVAFFLLIWIYFIIVANSYVLNGDKEYYN